MKVYHGSDTLVTVIDLQKCKPNRDFGRGFYVTKLLSQAESMAKRVARYSKRTPVITEYKFSEYAYEDTDLKVLRFDEYNEIWLDFVVLNRNTDISQAHDYDIVEGPVADDRITRNLKHYLKGDISKEEFLRMLVHSEPNHQICFCTINSLQMLTYVENQNDDIDYEISKIGEPLLEQFVLDIDIDAEKAADLFYSSKTFGKLADETTKLYQKSWTEIYEMFKKELKNENSN